jgi:hypothetical protein
MHHSQDDFSHKDFARRLERVAGQLGDLADHFVDWVCRDEAAPALERAMDVYPSLVPAKPCTSRSKGKPAPDTRRSPLVAQAERGISGIVIDHQAGMAYFTMGVPLPPRLLCLVAVLAAQAREETDRDGFPAFRSPEELAADEPSLRPAAVRQLVSRLRTIPGMNRNLIQTQSGRYRIRLRGDASFITIPPAGLHGAERTTSNHMPACDRPESVV